MHLSNKENLRVTITILIMNRFVMSLNVSICMPHATYSWLNVNRKISINQINISKEIRFQFNGHDHKFGVALNAVHQFYIENFHWNIECMFLRFFFLFTVCFAISFFLFLFFFFYVLAISKLTCLNSFSCWVIKH